MNDKLSAEERDILERFDRGELRPVTGAEREIEAARQAARKTSVGINRVRSIEQRTDAVREKQFYHS